METETQITTFRNIIDSYYYESLIESVRNGNKFFVIDFQDISKSNIELADDLLENPEECLKSAGIAISQFDLPVSHTPDIIIRIKNLPKIQIKRIRDLRSKHIGKFICLEGTIRQKSEIRPQIIAAKFECPSCGNIIPTLQIDSKFKEPNHCGCGRRGKFRMISKDLIDAQNVKLEEDIDALDGGEQPKRLNIFMQDDLITPLLEKRAYPGSKIKVNGYLKETPVILKNGGKSTRLEWIFEANYFESINEDFGEVKISDNEKMEIEIMSQEDDIIHRLVKSIAPSIYGHERIKEALLIQLVGGVKKYQQDGMKIRGDMHVLLIGDPGSGKSQLLKRINKIAPKSRFISGKGASAAGLTASVVRDDFMGGWALEAGALVLANKGLICIDELDKMSKDDTSAMHEALEGQLVTISKANIQATLKCETTVLAAANPKFGKFDLHAKTIADQFELPSTLINRFDLIFPIKDIPDNKKDEKLAKFLINVHIKSNNHKTNNQNTETSNNVNKQIIDNNNIIDTDMLRKYIAYVRTLTPIITEEASKQFVQYYLKMRQSGLKEGSVKSIPISARQLEGLIRMSEAFAKLRMRDKVTIEDANQAINLLDFCLNQIAFDDQTGTIDIDRITTGITASSRNNISILKDIINTLEDKFGKCIPISEISLVASDRGISEDNLEPTLDKLKKAGDVFEPRRGFISKF